MAWAMPGVLIQADSVALDRIESAPIQCDVPDESLGPTGGLWPASDAEHSHGMITCELRGHLDSERDLT